MDAVVAKTASRKMSQSKGSLRSMHVPLPSSEAVASHTGQLLSNSRVFAHVFTALRIIASARRCGHFAFVWRNAE